jgi:hypothetical protein
MKTGIALLIVLPLAGCRMSPNLSTLKTRAAFDMKCPAPSLDLTKLSPEVYGVSGCGRQATYVNGEHSWDDWTLNSTPGPEPVDQKPAAAAKP